jgi:hypothetical protein
MHDVIMNRVEGSKIEAAPKPPDRNFIWFFSDEEPYICMGSRHVRIQRMNHQGNAHRVKTAPSQFWPVRGCGWREAFTDHVGKIHTGLFKDPASPKHSGPASASTGIRPLVFLKAGGRFFPLQARRNGLLKPDQVALYGNKVRCIHAGNCEEQQKTDDEKQI